MKYSRFVTVAAAGFAATVAVWRMAGYDAAPGLMRLGDQAYLMAAAQERRIARYPGTAADPLADAYGNSLSFGLGPWDAYQIPVATNAAELSAAIAAAAHGFTNRATAKPRLLFRPDPRGFGDPPVSRIAAFGLTLTNGEWKVAWGQFPSSNAVEEGSAWLYGTQFHWLRPGIWTNGAEVAAEDGAYSPPPGYLAGTILSVPGEDGFPPSVWPSARWLAAASNVYPRLVSAACYPDKDNPVSVPGPSYADENATPPLYLGYGVQSLDYEGEASAVLSSGSDPPFDYPDVTAAAQHAVFDSAYAALAPSTNPPYFLAPVDFATHAPSGIAWTSFRDDPFLCGLLRVSESEERTGWETPDLSFRAIVRAQVFGSETLAFRLAWHPALYAGDSPARLVSAARAVFVARAVEFEDTPEHDAMMDAVADAAGFRPARGGELYLRAVELTPSTTNDAWYPLWSCPGAFASAAALGEVAHVPEADKNQITYSVSYGIPWDAWNNAIGMAPHVWYKVSLAALVLDFGFETYTNAADWAGVEVWDNRVGGGE